MNMTRAGNWCTTSPHTPGCSSLRFDSGDVSEAPPLPWRLMVLALSTTVTPAEPQVAGPSRRYLALKDEGDDTRRPAAFRLQHCP